MEKYTTRWTKKDEKKKKDQKTMKDHKTKKDQKTKQEKKNVKKAWMNANFSKKKVTIKESRTPFLSPN